MSMVDCSTEEKRNYYFHRYQEFLERSTDKWSFEDYLVNRIATIEETNRQFKELIIKDV
jgi:hypothetical protein